MRRHYFFREDDFDKWLKVIREVKVKINYYHNKPNGIISKEEYVEANRIYQQYKIYLCSLNKDERKIISNITNPKKESANEGRFFYTFDMIENWKRIVIYTNHFVLEELDIKELGKSLKHLREQAGYYREEAAKYLNIAPSTLRSYEDGARIIRVGIIYKMVQLYECDFYDLFK